MAFILSATNGVSRRRSNSDLELTDYQPKILASTGSGSTPVDSARLKSFPKNVVVPAKSQTESEEVEPQGSTLGDYRTPKTDRITPKSIASPSPSSSGITPKIEEPEEVERWWIKPDGTVDEAERYKTLLQRNTKRSVFTEENPNLGFMMANPLSNGRVAWDILVMMLLILNVFLIPFQLAFDVSNLEYSNPAPSELLDGSFSAQSETAQTTLEKMDQSFWFNLCIDALFITDLIINFRTAVIFTDPKTSESQWVCRSKDVALIYLKGWFAIDIIGSFPLEAVMVNLDQNHFSRALKVPRLFKFFRLFKLLRLARLGRLERYISRARSFFKINPGVFNILRFIGVFFIVAHVMSCMLFFVGTLDYRDKYGEHLTWITETKIISLLPSDAEFASGNFTGMLTLKESDIATQYLVCFYWSITTMATVGFGDIKPITSAEVFICILNMIIGASVFSFIVGNMAQLLSRLDGRAANFRVKLESISQFMHDQHLPKDLQERVTEFMKYGFAHPPFSPQDEVVSELSDALRVQLAKHMYRELLVKVPIFQVADEKFIDEVVLKLQPLQCAPGDVILHHGEWCHSLYFVVRGEVDVYVPSDNRPIATFFEGNFFGEHILSKEIGSELSPIRAVARTWSQLYFLKKHDIFELLESFPQLQSYINEVSNRRLKKFSLVARAVGVLRAKNIFAKKSRALVAAKRERENALLTTLSGDGGSGVSGGVMTTITEPTMATLDASDGKVMVFDFESEPPTRTNMVTDITPLNAFGDDPGGKKLTERSASASATVRSNAKTVGEKGPDEMPTYSSFIRSPASVTPDPILHLLHTIHASVNDLSQRLAQVEVSLENASASNLRSPT